MGNIRNLIPPSRGEVVVTKEGECAVKFQNFVEEITTQIQDISEDIISLEGTTQVVVSGTYQTSGNTVVICNGPAVITLEPKPIDGTDVAIKRTNGSVTIKSDIVNIFSTAEVPEVILTREGTSIDLVYLSETDLWYIK